MNLRDFEYIYAIYRHQSITKAAEALFVSQPTLSVFLQNYEKALGVKLFEKYGKAYHLTYAGKRYMHYAEQILNLRENLRKEMSEVSKEEVGAMTIGILPGHSMEVIPKTLPRFQSTYPGIEVKLVEGHCADLQERLLAGEVDLVVFNNPDRDLRLNYDEISVEEVVLVTPKNHPLGKYGEAAADSIYPYMNLGHFADEAFILQESTQPIGRVARQLMEEAGISPNIKLITQGVHGGIHLAEAGLGCAFALLYSAEKPEKLANVDSYSLGPGGKMLRLTIATRKTDFLPRYIEEYISIVKSVYSTK